MRFISRPQIDAEVDDDGAGLALAVLDADALAIALRDLRQQRQRIVVVGEAHRLARLQAVECAEDRRMAEALGHAAGVEGVDGVG